MNGGKEGGREGGRKGGRKERREGGMKEETKEREVMFTNFLCFSHQPPFVASIVVLVISSMHVRRLSAI